MNEKDLEKILPALLGIAARGAAAGAMDMEESTDLKKHYPGDEGYDEKNTAHLIAMQEGRNKSQEDWMKDPKGWDRASNEEERQRVKAANESRGSYESLGRSRGSDLWEGWDEEHEQDKKDYARRTQAGLAQRSRRSGKVDEPKPDSSTYDEDPQMGELEARIAQKPRNRPDYPLRTRTPDVRRDTSCHTSVRRRHYCSQTNASSLWNWQHGCRWSSGTDRSRPHCIRAPCPTSDRTASPRDHLAAHRSKGSNYSYWNPAGRN